MIELCHLGYNLTVTTYREELEKNQPSFIRQNIHTVKYFSMTNVKAFTFIFFCHFKFCHNRRNGFTFEINYKLLHCNPVQGSTGIYREIPVMKTGTLQ